MSSWKDRQIARQTMMRLPNRGLCHSAHAAMKRTSKCPTTFRPIIFTTGLKNAQAKNCAIRGLRIKVEKVMAKTIARRKLVVRRDWTRAEVKELRQHSKDKTRVKTISRALKRTPGALRQKARVLGIPLGHRRTKKKRA